MLLNFWAYGKKNSSLRSKVFPPTYLGGLLTGYCEKYLKPLGSLLSDT